MRVFLWIVGIVSARHLNDGTGEPYPMDISISIEPFDEKHLVGAKTLLERYGQPGTLAALELSRSDP